MCQLYIVKNKLFSFLPCAITLRLQGMQMHSISCRWRFCLRVVFSLLALFTSPSACRVSKLSIVAAFALGKLFFFTFVIFRLQQGFSLIMILFFYFMQCQRIFLLPVVLVDIVTMCCCCCYFASWFLAAQLRNSQNVTPVRRSPFDSLVVTRNKFNTFVFTSWHNW